MPEYIERDMLCRVLERYQSNCRDQVMHCEYRWSDKRIYPICPNCRAKMYEG